MSPRLFLVDLHANPEHDRTTMQNPNLNKEQWSSSKDSLLLGKFGKPGPKWSVIARFFQRREKNEVRHQILALRQRTMRAPVFPSSCPSDYPVSEEKTQESSDSAEVILSQEAAIDGDSMPWDPFFSDKPKWSIQMSWSRFYIFQFAFACIRLTQLGSMGIKHICHISSKSLTIGTSDLSTQPTQRRTMTSATALI
jgi:hypothetical protein